MAMPNRTSNSPDYRYGFNGKEKDESGEWGDLTHYDYGFRVYNPGIGKFLSVDPLFQSYPELTPYQFASNRPIDGIDLDGLEYKPIADWYDKNIGTHLQISKWEHEEDDGWVEFGAKFTGNTLVSLTNGITSSPSFIIGNLTAQDQTETVIGAGSAASDYLSENSTEEILDDLEEVATDPGTYENLAAIILTRKMSTAAGKGSKVNVKVADRGGPGAKLKDGAKIKPASPYRVEASLSNKPTRTHGYKWSDGDAIARAKKTGNVQGRFGSKADADFAVAEAQKLKIGERKLIPANQGNKNSLIGANGKLDKAPTHIFIEVKPAGKNGTIHAFPAPADYKVTPRSGSGG